MVRPGREDGHAGRHREVTESPLKSESLPDHGLQIGLQSTPPRSGVVEADHGALEEGTTLGIVGVLVEGLDVGAVGGEYLGDRCHDARLIRAVNEEAEVVVTRRSWGGHLRVSREWRVLSSHCAVARSPPNV